MIKSSTIDDLGIVGFFPATIGNLGIISLLCDYDWKLFGVSLIAPVHMLRKIHNYFVGML